MNFLVRWRRYISFSWLEASVRAMGAEGQLASSPTSPLGSFLGSRMMKFTRTKSRNCREIHVQAHVKLSSCLPSTTQTRVYMTNCRLLFNAVVFTVNGLQNVFSLSVHYLQLIKVHESKHFCSPLTMNTTASKLKESAVCHSEMYVVVTFTQVHMDLVLDQ